MPNIAPIVASPTNNPVLSQKEMQTHCLKFLSISDISAVGSVNKEWNERLKNATPVIINSEFQRHQDILIKAGLLSEKQRIKVTGNKSANFSKLLEDQWKALAEMVRDNIHTFTNSSCDDVARPYFVKENVPYSEKFFVCLQIAEISKKYHNNQPKLDDALYSLSLKYCLSSNHYIDKRLDLAIFIADKISNPNTRESAYLKIGIKCFDKNDPKLALEINSKITLKFQNNTNDTQTFLNQLIFYGFIKEAIENLKKDASFSDLVMKALMYRKSIDEATEVMLAYPDTRYDEKYLAKVISLYILNGDPEKAVAFVEKMHFDLKKESKLMSRCASEFLHNPGLYTLLAAMPDSELRDQLCINTLNFKLNQLEAIKIILLIGKTSERVVAEQIYVSCFGEAFEFGLARHGYINELIKYKNPPNSHKVLSLLVQLGKFEDAEQYINAFPAFRNFLSENLTQVFSHFILKGQSQRSIALMEKMKDTTGEHVLEWYADYCKQDPDIHTKFSAIAKIKPIIKPSRTQLGKQLVANLWKKNVWYRVFSCLTVGLLPLFTFLFGVFSGNKIGMR